MANLDHFFLGGYFNAPLQFFFGTLSWLKNQEEFGDQSVHYLEIHLTMIYIFIAYGRNINKFYKWI